MAECCNDNLNKIFCDAYNKYYNTLYTNGEISKKETDNLLVISYLRKLFINPRYIDYRPILIKALRCIANRSCLLDSSELYGRLGIKTVANKYVTVLMKDIYSIKETDPTVPLYVKNITELDIDRWNNPSTNGILIVKFTENNNIVTCDTSIADIYAAFSADREVVGHVSDGQVNLFVCTENTVAFYWIYGDAVNYIIGSTNNNVDSWEHSIAYIQEKLTFDNTPTANSSNPVKSGGVYTALSGKLDTSALANYCPIIEDTRSSAVAAITGVAPFSTLVNGQRIMFKVAQNIPNSPTLTLTLSGGTTTSAIPMYTSYISTPLSDVWNNYIRAGMYVELVYESTNSRWVMIGNRDSNTTYQLLTQSDINNGSSTAQKLITPQQVHDNAYIVETTYSSGSLKANKMYDFGTVSSALTIPSLDANNDLVSNALNFYALRFIAGADNISITFPTGVVVDDTPTINTGDYVEIMINLYVVNGSNNFYASIKVWQAQ